MLAVFPENPRPYDEGSDELPPEQRNLSMTPKKVLSLGQCAADHWSISRLFSDSLRTAVTEADSFEEALELLRRENFALVLVNRVLDANGASGLDFITRLKADETLRSVPVMLVSNYADAQRQAVAKGAPPGFGKAAASPANHAGTVALRPRSDGRTVSALIPGNSGIGRSGSRRSREGSVPPSSQRDPESTTRRSRTAVPPRRPRE